jgi:hypothetical protein
MERGTWSSSLLGQREISTGANDSRVRVEWRHFGRPELTTFRRIHDEHTDQMRSYGMYVYRPGGQEILLDALRRR